MSDFDEEYVRQQMEQVDADIQEQEYWLECMDRGCEASGLALHAVHYQELQQEIPDRKDRLTGLKGDREILDRKWVGNQVETGEVKQEDAEAYFDKTYDNPDKYLKEPEVPAEATITVETDKSLKDTALDAVGVLLENDIITPKQATTMLNKVHKKLDVKPSMEQLMALWEKSNG